MEELMEMTYADQLAEALSKANNLNIGVFEDFRGKGLPLKKNEEYKFTYVQKFLESNFDLANLEVQNDYFSSADIKKELHSTEGYHLVFINGRFSKEDSVVPSGNLNFDITEEIPFSPEKMAHEPFAVLNKASNNEFVHLTVPRNTKSEPVFIYNFFGGKSNVVCTPTYYVTAEEGSSIDVLEKTILGEGSANVFSNRVVAFDVKKNASANVSAIQNYADGLFEVNNLFANQDRDSRFYSNVFTFRGNMIRNNIYLDLLAENCESHMHGVYLLNGKSHVDNHTTVDHKLPNCMSNELYKGIVDEKATAVFNGKIYVRPNAQQTNAYQTNNNISLSDTATIHTKPQLEIWADDVKCSHGCTIGQLDEDAIFYLRARGIDETMAKAMMLVAFSEEAFEYIPFEFLKEELHELIQKRLIR